MPSSLVFGGCDGDRVVMGPLVVTADDRSRDGRVDFVRADIELWLGGRCEIRLTGRNGIEALALRHLRDALRELMRTASGTAYFGDHDFYEIVTFTARPDGTVDVHASIPELDRWEVSLAPMTEHDLARTIEVIDAVEMEFGDLVGYCEGCGSPPATYQGGQAPEDTP